MNALQIERLRVEIRRGARVAWSEANHLHFEHKLNGDPLPVLAALHNLTQKQGYLDVILDFQRVVYLSSAFMLPLVTMCRWYRHQRVSFELLLPEDRKSSALFNNTNWAHLIDPEKFDRKIRIIFVICRLRNFLQRKNITDQLIVASD